MDNLTSDPFPTLKDKDTRILRLKDTAAILSPAIPDLEIRALCPHPSASSNKFNSKKDSSYAGTFDVDKVELVHSRLAAAVVELNQGQVNPTTATGFPGATEWTKEMTLNFTKRVLANKSKS